VAVEALAPSATTTPVWTEVHRFAARVTVQPLELGVILAGGGTWVLAGHGALVDDPAALADSPRALESSDTVVGTWPSDAWRVAVTDVERSSYDLAFYKWRGNRWVAQSFVPPGEEGKVRQLSDTENYWLYRKSPRSGFLLADPLALSSGITRIAGAHPAPAGATIPSAEDVQDFYETRAGSIVLVGNAEVHVGCAYQQSSCTAPTVRTLPEKTHAATDSDGERWAAIGRHGFARVMQTIGGPDARLLLVHDGQHMTLGEIAGDREVQRVLGTTSGVLWVVTSGTGADRLLRRDRAGEWTTVALPEAIADAPTIGIALRDAERLWVVGMTGDAATAFELGGTPSADQAG